DRRSSPRVRGACFHCEALKTPDRYGSKLIVMVGMLTILHGWPTLTATCDSMLASGGLTWTNAVLLPEAAAPQRSPTLPKILQQPSGKPAVRQARESLQSTDSSTYPTASQPSPAPEILAPRGPTSET